MGVKVPVDVTPPLPKSEHTHRARNRPLQGMGLSS